ncbi:cytidine deaminase [Ureaplasma canigenitalium]|uniref:cytidine deaminase n=1 Tax=Ureaplasma canigenitalium TaxID=42092 RepID=UPI0004E1E473|nr:cytidine deaminase [Ureaplasma canigenitalium]
MEKIYNELKKLLKNAYCPYSNYPVAAIVETDQGTFPGVNVENGSYPLGLCAERTAVCNAITYGAKIIKNIYLITKNNGYTGTPCGGCRQVISEFIDKKDGRIYCFNFDGTFAEYKIDDLLGHYWTPDSLEVSENE